MFSPRVSRPFRRSVSIADVRAVLPLDDARALAIAPRVFRRPPVAHVARRVVLAGRSRRSRARSRGRSSRRCRRSSPASSYVDGEEGRLQPSGREDDLVERRAVVRVHRRRRHQPLVAVHRLADRASHVALTLMERARRTFVGVRVRPRPSSVGVVLPAIGVADLLVERRELRAAPAARVRSLIQSARVIRSRNTSRRLCTTSSIFAFAAGVNSVFTYSRPSASPSDLIGRDEASAPPRLLLARAGEHRRELERFVDERRAELRRAAPEHRPPQIRLPVVERARGERAAERAEERRRVDRDRLRSPSPIVAEVARPVDAGGRASPPRRSDDGTSCSDRAARRATAAPSPAPSRGRARVPRAPSPPPSSRRRARTSGRCSRR